MQWCLLKDSYQPCEVDAVTTPVFQREEGICSWLLVKGQGQGQDPMSVSLIPEPAHQTTWRLRAQSPIYDGLRRE